ncbi:glycoside hydrolase family 78 protein [Sphaerisporangium perillae]
MRCEHRAEPMGVDAPGPRLSWRPASRRGHGPRSQSRALL